MRRVAPVSSCKHSKRRFRVGHEALGELDWPAAGESISWAACWQTDGLAGALSLSLSHAFARLSVPSLLTFAEFTQRSAVLKKVDTNGTRFGETKKPTTAELEEKHFIREQKHLFSCRLSATPLAKRQALAGWESC